MSANAAEPELHIPSPIETISERDEMFTGSLPVYFEVGRSAMENVFAALRMAGRTTCQSILDLPCGHGRVMRYLRTAFPDAQLTACDLNRDGVEFCAETFGATTVYSQQNIDEVTIAGEFDLIWCGSLLTHLDEPMWEPFLAFFEAHLADNGVLMFTTHGRRSAVRMRARNGMYGPDPKPAPPHLASYEKTGFGYIPYPNRDDYGTSVSKPSWVLERLQKHPRLRVILLNEAGWDNYQDVFACVRARPSF
jgi:SAM-dependent methyltransferase